MLRVYCREMKYQRLGVAEIGADARHNLDGNCKKQAGVDASRQHRAAAKGCRSAVKDLEPWKTAQKLL
jgi:hypothetical protein